jgi:outer membrane protein OmpA-like peptidoglycan-associated protein
MKITILAFLLFAVTFTVSAQDYLVQVAVYDQAVPAYHFSDLNSRIFYAKDSNNFHRYYIGKYDKSDAESQATAARGKGFKGVSVENMDSFGKPCACGFVPKPKEITASLRSIFFDFDRYFLRSTSKTRLNELVQTLRENPSHRARLMAHTDAKGSNSYNETLSLNRANSAKQYLIARGISSSRIDTQTFGETTPIAKNELEGGQDTETGRQFNRRVELIVLNGAGEPMNIVDEIDVPDSLQAN